MIRWLAYAITIYSVLASHAFAQGPSARASASAVTILSDGLSEPDSPVSQILTDVSVMIDKDNSLRVLPVMGYGGEANVRDLLQLRGADLAVLNGDILAYLDQSRASADARRKVRAIAPLFNQSVFLFARAPLKSIGDLKGRKLGVPSSHPSRLVTAKTIFGLSKVDVNILELSDKEFAVRLSKDLDAFLLFEKDLPKLNSFGVSPGAFHLIPIPSSGSLAKVYLPKKYSKSALGDFAPEKDLQTIQVTTLLAAFDWNDKQSRYADVVKFTQKLFGILPELRAQHPASLLNTADIRLEIPGWQRYGPAEAMIATVPALPTKEDNASLAALSLARPAQDDKLLKLSVVARPPLTNSLQADGGLILNLFSDALASNGMRLAINWDDNERAQLDSLLTKKTAEVALFIATPGCDNPKDLSANTATTCDQLALSEPIMQVVIGLFTRRDTVFSTDEGSAGQSRVFCLPENQDIPNTASSPSPVFKTGAVKFVHLKTLIDCIAAVERREADGMIASEPEGRFAIERLKLSGVLQMSPYQVGTAGLHAAVAKDNKRAPELLSIINRGISNFKASERYAAAVAAHLEDLSGESAAKMP